MTFLRQVPRTLDEEHRASLALLDKVERALTRTPDADWPALARQLAHQLEQETGRHFGFEEEQLFPRMSEVGDGGMVGLLTEEHDAIRDVAAELLPLVRAAAAGSLPASDMPALKRLALELVERQVAHIQKETMALLPLLDDMLDEDTDRELAFAYA